MASESLHEVVPGQEMKELASSNTAFSHSEVEKVVRSLQILAEGTDESIDWDAFRNLVSRTAHLSHKNWVQTEKSANELSEIFGGPDHPSFQKMFQRVLSDGNWAGGLRASATAEKKPWAVLVTGLNGIRKTTSIYQPWFKACLSEALRPEIDQEQTPLLLLPSGDDSFFRQLDYMIATLAAEDFASLYGFAARGCSVDNYSVAKESIFARYRTLAETLGIVLVREAQRRGMNVMVETSGRDLASFAYMDHLFPDDNVESDAAEEHVLPASSAPSYTKLVVHFTVNDLGFAERSVDQRMVGEMAAGANLLQKETPCTSKSTSVASSPPPPPLVRPEVSAALVAVNAGGPYGSKILGGVQADSDRVWKEVSSSAPTASASGSTGGDNVQFSTWRKANIAINAKEEGSWTARAVRSPFNQGHPFGNEYEFRRP